VGPASFQDNLILDRGDRYKKVSEEMQLGGVTACALPCPHA
jgi:hypothetical protein